MKKVDFWKTVVKKGAVLNPVDRISEVLFGLIMVLTFTGAISVATDGRDAVQELLWAALGCNLAWGLVDAIMYVMSVLLERGHILNVIHKLNRSTDKTRAAALLKDELSPAFGELLTPEELAALAVRIQSMPVPSHKNLLTSRDFLSAFQIFILVFTCTLPIALPFAFIPELEMAMRVSNGIALFMLGVGGFILAGYAGFNRWLTAISYAVIGVLLVGLTMALGG